jgi:hypothetical protein
MNKIALTAPCGLDCFNCPVLEDNITEEYKKQVSGFLGITPEETPCGGCINERGHCKFATDGHCSTWDCVQEKGVTYCHECSDFPCELLMPSQQGAQFPHNIKVYNLCRMKLLGIDKWIEEAAEIRMRYFQGKFEVGKGPVFEK